MAGRISAPDRIAAESIELARQAAEDAAGDFGVGEHVGVQPEQDRVVIHLFECLHPAYRSWQWAVTLVRAARARVATVNDVVLLPSPDVLLPPAWVPWSDRIAPGDITPGTILPTPDNDPRLEPGFTGGEGAAGEDPAEASEIRALVAELGLGRVRVLSAIGRGEAAERWLAGEPGADNQWSRLAPAQCLSCGYFVRLAGSLGTLFGGCTNEFSPFDAKVVSVHHGCGGHSDVVGEERGIELAEPVFDTLSEDTTLFD